MVDLRSRVADFRQGVLQWAEVRLPALTRYRQPESLPVRLHRRRIYVLPTRFGVYATALLAVMLLGALNFNNNAALLLTYALGGVLLLSPWHAVRAIEGVVLERIEAEPVHAGQIVPVDTAWSVADSRHRIALDLTGGAAPVRFDLAGEGRAGMQLPTRLRGWQAVPALTLASDAPFGLFRAWSVLRPAQSLLVWPQPEVDTAALPDRGTEIDRRARLAEGEDFEGLRDYRPGDPPRRVAWKASARSERLLVRDPAMPAAGPLDLRWDDTASLPFELRVSRMTRWVIEAAGSGRRFRMQLPDMMLGPERGNEFRNRCLRALALL